MASKPNTTDTKIRVSKIMADRGMCSRREADAWIEKGWVKVDDVVIGVGHKADPSCQIELAPGARQERAELVTILLNKPVGYVSGQPEPAYEPAVRLITKSNHFVSRGEPELQPMHFEGLAPAGRLDIDSKGLLVFTQDGRVARDLIGESTSIEKEYLVRVEGEMKANGLKLLRHGLSLDGYKLMEAQVEWQNEDQLRFVLREGKKRQIRRMCEQVGLTVVGLKRVRIGRVLLGNLPEGQWRFLSASEKF